MLIAAQPLPAPVPEPGPADWFREVLATERDAISRFIAACPSTITAIVTTIAAEERPIVCTGVGKSGLVAAKLAATFSSLGTPAFFLNAAEASHGDLGAVQTGNVVVMLSNSGATEEIMRILPLLKARECRLIGIIGRSESPLARSVDLLIPAGVEREADHIGMAPTASTTLHIAIGDAIAVAVSCARGFDKADFLRHHPAGLLGRHMIPVRHLMRAGEDVPMVLPHASIAEALPVISAKRLGATCVTDWEGRLVGLLTDGDVRRLIEARGDLYATPVSAVMRSDPHVIACDATFADVIEMLQGQERHFSVLPVISPEGRLEGVVQTYDLMQS